MISLLSRSPARTLPLVDGPSRRLAGGLIALQVFVAALAIAGTTTLHARLQAAAFVAERDWLVQIATESLEAGDRLGEEALAALRARDEIAAANLLPRQAVMTLLAPWLGRDIGDDFPLPITLEVTTRAGHDMTAETIRALLPAGPDYGIHGYAGWREPVRGAADGFRFVTAGLVGLASLAAVGTIVFATRAALAANRRTIDLLHLIGAEDAHIAKRFAIQALLTGGIGGLLGAVGGGLAAFGAAVAALPRPELDAAGLAAEAWFLAPMAAMPLCAAFLSFATAWATVTAWLRTS